MRAARAEIVGPFDSYKLVVDGYTVPCVDARENDGGTVTFIVDERLAWTVPAAAFEDVAALVANVYAVGLGLPCHPKADEEPPAGFKRVPVMLRPRRILEITFSGVGVK